MLKSIFKVDDKPFFSIGGQVNNSSTYNREDILRSFDIARKIGLNTIAVPIYWNQIEKEKDVYDTSIIDLLIEQCEKHNLKLCLIWFGIYKNGASSYVPNYLKENADIYWPIHTIRGLITSTLSPICEATKKREQDAYEMVILKLKEVDKKGATIGLQIENEPGSLGAARDYSPRGEASFSENVPADLLDLINSLDDCPLRKFYLDNGSKSRASWADTFGFYAAEIYMSYYCSKYINDIAAIAKKHLKLPTYLNCWTSINGSRVPGFSYPSGGPTMNAIEIYKRFAPNIDTLSPDVYALGATEFFNQVTPYARKDNILFIPETFPFVDQYPYIFQSIKEHALSGVHSFGIDVSLHESGELNERAVKYQKVVTILNNAKSLLEEKIGSLDFISIYQIFGEMYEHYELGGYILKVVFFNKNNPVFAHVDARHRSEALFTDVPLGFVFKGDDDTFYVVGQGFTVNFTKKVSLEQVTDSLLYDTSHSKNCFRPFLEIQEGTYADGKFIPERSRNGDEIDYGVWVTSDVKAVRVRFPKKAAI